MSPRDSWPETEVRHHFLLVWFNHRHILCSFLRCFQLFVSGFCSRLGNASSIINCSTDFQFISSRSLCVWSLLGNFSIFFFLSLMKIEKSVCWIWSSNLNLIPACVKKRERNRKLWVGVSRGKLVHCLPVASQITVLQIRHADFFWFW